jgi:preprotein translocase subunit Sss1
MARSRDPRRKESTMDLDLALAGILIVGLAATWLIPS